MKDTKKLALLSLIFMFLNSCGFDVHEAGCKNLKSIVGDEKKISSLWLEVRAMILDPQPIRESGEIYGTINSLSLPSGYGIDWSEYDIKARIGTVGFYNHDELFDLREFDRAKLDEVRVGYGGRQHIYFTLEDLHGHSSLNDESKSLKYKAVRVECYESR